MKMTAIMIMTQVVKENEEVKDDDEEEDKFVNSPSNYTPTDDEDETNVESKDDDNAEGDEDKGKDDTTNLLYDDVDVRNKNLEITLDQVIEDAHVTISTVAKKTEVLVTSSSHSSDLASKFLNFADIPPTDAEIVSPMDVHVQHEVPSGQIPTLLTVPVTSITESSPVYTTAIPQSSPSFTPPPPQSTPTLPPTNEATNPLSALLDFASVFQFNNRVSALEKAVSELRNDDPLKTQVTAQVNEHLDSRLEATRDVFMNYLSTSITARITEQSSYEVAATLTEFELKKILIDKIEKSQSYLTATEHIECYDGLIKSYDLEKSLFSTYVKVYSLKRSREDKDKDEDPSAGSDRELKKRKTSKDVEPTKGPKNKESKSSSFKGTKSQSKSSGKSIQVEEPEFEVADSDMPPNQERNLGNDDEEPIREDAPKCDWFTKPKQLQEPTDPDWNVYKTLQHGPTQSWLMTLAANADKPSKTFDELMSTPINFSAYIMNCLKITNLTQETLLGSAFKLLKGTRYNFIELEYDFEECYKALSEKLDWDNPEGGDYPFNLTKPLPLVMKGNHQTKSVDYFFNNDLKYLQGGISTMTYTTSTTKIKAAQYDLSGIEDMTFYVYAQGLKSTHDVYSTKRILAVTRFEVMRKHSSDFAIALPMFTRSIVIQKRVKDLQLGVESYQKKINVTKPETTRPGIKKKDPYTPYQDPQGFIYVDNQGRNRLMRSDELYTFSDGTLTRLRTSLEDITKNIHMEYLPKRRWSSLEKKRVHFMIKAIDKLQKERRIMRSLEKFVGGRDYETDLWLLQRTI
ncbi:hypothetical protein Tco_0704542 [Tanacetum coccineum]|uniref:Uncharacterized protein n=1 Tax=Tanacetum coccineum TaxID=301880 RepID=A0ABQ4Y3G0_9ASTR